MPLMKDGEGIDKGVDAVAVFQGLDVADDEGGIVVRQECRTS